MQENNVYPPKCLGKSNLGGHVIHVFCLDFMEIGKVAYVCCWKMILLTKTEIFLLHILRMWIITRGIHYTGCFHRVFFL